MAGLKALPGDVLNFRRVACGDHEVWGILTDAILPRFIVIEMSDELRPDDVGAESEAWRRLLRQ